MVKRNGCDFDSGTFEFAASNGNLDNVKWLKENGCKFDDITFSCAIMEI